MRNAKAKAQAHIKRAQQLLNESETLAFGVDETGFPLMDLPPEIFSMIIDGLSPKARINLALTNQQSKKNTDVIEKANAALIKIASAWHKDETSVLNDATLFREACTLMPFLFRFASEKLQIDLAREVFAIDPKSVTGFFTTALDCIRDIFNTVINYEDDGERLKGLRRIYSIKLNTDILSLIVQEYFDNESQAGDVDELPFLSDKERFEEVIDSEKLRRKQVCFVANPELFIEYFYNMRNYDEVRDVFAALRTALPADQQSTYLNFERALLNAPQVEGTEIPKLEDLLNDAKTLKSSIVS